MGSKLRFLTVLAGLGLAVGCGKHPSHQLPSSPSPDAGPDADGGVDPTHTLARLDDINPDPHIVEVNLSASNQTDWNMGGGIVAHGFSYNGAHPGPLLEANIGDTIIVHFKNDLPWPTSIHWHGMRVPSAMDGTMAVQSPIEPGGKLDYQFVAKDPGLFWYHPHVDARYEVELGLYGAILIHQPGEPQVAFDQPLVLDDVLLDGQGQIQGMDPFGPDPATGGGMGGGMGGMGSGGDELMNGRLGNALLANGRTDLSLPVTQGTWVLFRIVNAANARIMKLSLEGHTLHVVGLDQGFLPTPYDVTSLTIAPGERYAVLVQMNGEPGQSYHWNNSTYTMGTMGMSSDPMGSRPNPIATLTYAPGSVAETPMPIFPSADAPDLHPDPSHNYTHTWMLGMTMQPMEHTLDGQIWPNVPVLTYPANGNYTFLIDNQDMEVHPFHIHGQRFQVVQIDQDVQTARGWKDTVIVSPGSQVMIRTTLDNPGDWMYHCHILEHEDMGMMGELVVQ